MNSIYIRSNEIHCLPLACDDNVDCEIAREAAMLRFAKFHYVKLIAKHFHIAVLNSYLSRAL